MRRIVKHNAKYGSTPPVPIGWSLSDREHLPGERLLYYKDPETDLLTPAEPHILDEDETHKFYSTPTRLCLQQAVPEARSVPEAWDLEHRGVAGFGCNEPSPFVEGEGKVLNERIEGVKYHEWCEKYCFQQFAEQRGLVWHWQRYKSVITASRLDTILYNGYIVNDSIPVWDVIAAREHLFKILTCQTPQETITRTNNVEEDHLWRGVYGEDYIKKALSARSDRRPILMEVGSIPIPGYRWIRVSLDAIDAERGINYEMKSPRPLLRFFRTYPIDASQYAELVTFQKSLVRKYQFPNPALNQFEKEVDFLAMHALRQEGNTRSYEELCDAVGNFTFRDQEPFYDFGRQQYLPEGYKWTEEHETSDLGFYFYQTNVQNQIGVSATELVKWDCLTGTLKAIRIKQRNIMYDVAVELQKFWDDVHRYRVQHHITFRDFYKVNHLEELGDLPDIC